MFINMNDVLMFDVNVNNFVFSKLYFWILNNIYEAHYVLHCKSKTIINMKICLQSILTNLNLINFQLYFLFKFNLIILFFYFDFKVEWKKNIYIINFMNTYYLLFKFIHVSRSFCNIFLYNAELLGNNKINNNTVLFS